MHRPPAFFIADAIAVDFLNSVATPVDRPVDWLDSGEGLLSWLEQAGLVPAEVLSRFRAQSMPGEFDSVAAQARALREWFRSFIAERKGGAVDADLAALEPLNRLLERDEGFNRIVPRGEGADGPLELRSLRRWRSPESLLLPIAESLARFVCEVDFGDVKACEGDNCTLMFADRTRGRQRRWCSMAVCGNRAKQAAHRSRAKART